MLRSVKLDPAPIHAIARRAGSRAPPSLVSVQVVAKPSPRATIVVAEDDVATRLILRHVLESENFRVVAVENGKLACEAVRRERPDLVLLDWLMPIMDGRAALEELQASHETRAIPIIMLTSQSELGERIIALESGVQDFISKPFDTRELVACIDQQLRRSEYLAVDANLAYCAERRAQLAVSERRYRMLAEAMPQIVLIADSQGETRFLNGSWSDYIGHHAEGRVSTAWAAAVHADDRATYLQGWRESLSSGNPYEAQIRLRRESDGMYRWHLARAVPTRDESDAITEWVVSYTDIHDYRIANETRAMLDIMGSIVSISCDEGYVDYASPFWSQYTGSPTGSALGLGWRSFVHADDLRQVDASRTELRASAGHSRQSELRIRAGNGEYHWFQSQTTLLPQPAGSPRRWLQTATNVDDLKRMQSALANSETRYRVLTDSMPQMVWVIDARAKVEYVNHRWSDYTGLDLAQTRGAGSASIVHPDELGVVESMLATPAEMEFTCEARLRRGDGVFRWHAVHAVPFRDHADQSRKWIGTATDIEDNRESALALARTAAELEHLAHHDPMTKLPNRTLLVERLAQAIAVAQRAKTQILVLYVDLDNFKSINDTRGHGAGDRVLEVTGERISAALRLGDIACRVGGDEFVLVCATTEAAADAERLAERLLNTIVVPIEIDGEYVSVGASIGMSVFPADGSTGEALIHAADSAMYSAKQSGRNRFRSHAG